MANYKVKTPVGDIINIAAPKGLSKDSVFNFAVREHKKTPSKLHLVVPKDFYKEDGTSDYEDLSSYLNFKKQERAEQKAGKGAFEKRDTDKEESSDKESETPSPIDFDILGQNYDYIKGTPITGSLTSPLNQEKDQNLTLPIGQQGQVTISGGSDWQGLDLQRQIANTKIGQLFLQGGVDSYGLRYAGLTLNKKF